jgi:hypothetical protein
MKHRIFVAAALVCLGGLCVDAIAQTGAHSSSKKSKSAPGKASQGSPNEGEKRFLTNCGRCHNPPEDISPREARAVVRHMRVRAMLSAEDERLILEFLAP